MKKDFWERFEIKRCSQKSFLWGYNRNVQSIE